MVCKTKKQVLKKFPLGIDKLEIGSGDNPERGYVHLDIQKNLPDLDILADVRKMPIQDNFVSGEIRAVHIMEHFCHPQHSSASMRKKWGTTLEVLKECYRVLKPGGVLKIVTPDFNKITRSGFLGIVKKNWLQRWTVGGHDNEFDVHHWLWTHQDAHRWFSEVGFQDLRDWNIARWWRLHWWTDDKPGNKYWHNVEWYHWLFFIGTK